MAIVITIQFISNESLSFLIQGVIWVLYFIRIFSVTMKDLKVVEWLLCVLLRLSFLKKFELHFWIITNLWLTHHKNSCKLLKNFAFYFMQRSNGGSLIGNIGLIYFPCTNFNDQLVNIELLNHQISWDILAN